VSTDSGIAAVLWDMDGTLVDTEPYWIEAEYRLIRSFGGSWNDDHARALVGNPLLVSAEYIRKHAGVPLPAPEIVDRLLLDVVAATEANTVWLPGVWPLLAELRTAGVPCAMVTMSYRNLAEAVAAQLPPGTFDALVTGDQLHRGKPDPEAYLRAAELLGVSPLEAIAIEDSPPGIASAEAAGCRVVAVPNHVPIAPGPRRAVITTLQGMTLAGLAAAAPGPVVDGAEAPVVASRSSDRDGGGKAVGG
jgi:HAD superfamily hydrolase (TIGR01509 family)